jgi:TatD DNase family protein
VSTPEGPPSLVDSHAHLDDPKFADDLDAVLARARDAGVERIVSIGTDLDSSRRARDLAAAREGVWFSPGIHPHDADRGAPVDELKELLVHPKAAAIGETGLDYFKDYASVPNQKALFARHLELAQEFDKPVSIHCRDAHGDAVQILRAHGPLRGVIHCFTGTWADAEAYMGLNFMISIAGPVTYPNAKALREAVELIPLDVLMIETDCPLLAPQKHRGQRNEPGYVRHTLAEIANVKGLDVREVAEATTRNARRLFGI